MDKELKILQKNNLGTLEKFEYRYYTMLDSFIVSMPYFLDVMMVLWLFRRMSFSLGNSC